MENSVNAQISHVRGVIEALLFVNEKPVTLEQIKGVLETVTVGDIRTILEQIKAEYETRNNGMNIIEIAGGYQMMTNQIYAEYVRKFYKTKHKEKLSKPALETLAIIAYKQPVTRQDIEMIRGVNSDGVVTHLVNKELIKIVGRKDVPGRPFLHGTTKQFLDYFGLKSLEDLPQLKELSEFQLKEMDDHAPEQAEKQGEETKQQTSEENFDEKQPGEEAAVSTATGKQDVEPIKEKFSNES